MRTNVLIGSMALALAGSVLAGCGSQGSSAPGASGDYCSQLKADKADLSSISGTNPDFGKLDDMFQRVHSLAAAAPSAVSSDWKTLDNAVTTIQTALKDAGLKPSDLAAMQKGQLPQGADLQKIQALGTKLQSLNGSDVTSAAQAIAKNAKSSCGVDLNTS
jgi:hypothetical protein